MRLNQNPEMTNSVPGICLNSGWCHALYHGLQLIREIGAGLKSPLNLSGLSITAFQLEKVSGFRVLCLTKPKNTLPRPS
jgi:hypothetical protein